MNFLLIIAKNTKRAMFEQHRSSLCVWY